MEHHQAEWEVPIGCLSFVLSLCGPKALARCQAVCRAWREVATDPQVRRAAFIHHWKLLGCHGEPKQVQFYETAAVTSFVREHQVQRTDSLQMLAVRHGVTVPCLKRVNNLISDHSLHSRTHLFIPVVGEHELHGRLVCFKYCANSKRNFAVLLAAPQTDDNGGSSSRSQQQSDELEKQQHVHGGGSERPRPGSSAYTADVLQARLCHMLGRSLAIDTATAQFYLEDAGGDMKTAMEAFAQDVAWEGTTAGPMRTVPIQRWISGELGL